jgi:hypothetical protein
MGVAELIGDEICRVARPAKDKDRRRDSGLELFALVSAVEATTHRSRRTPPVGPKPLANAAGEGCFHAPTRMRNNVTDERGREPRAYGGRRA